jgi:hypothetical protein
MHAYIPEPILRLFLPTPHREYFSLISSVLTEKKLFENDTFIFGCAVRCFAILEL